MRRKKRIGTWWASVILIAVSTTASWPRWLIMPLSRRRSSGSLAAEGMYAPRRSVGASRCAGARGIDEDTKWMVFAGIMINRRHRRLGKGISQSLHGTIRSSLEKHCEALQKEKCYQSSLRRYISITVCDIVRPPNL
ncbi:unnamed protein product [Victoria cruziana]